MRSRARARRLAWRAAAGVSPRSLRIGWKPLSRHWEAFSASLDYVSLSAGAGVLKEAVSRAEAALGPETRRVHYLSVPPKAALPAVQLLADHRVVHDHRVHADKGVPAHPAAVQHGAVTDVPIFLDHRIGAGKAVHHASVLQVRATLQDQSPEVAAQACTRPHIAVRADDHVADQHR